jgi:hypothetical protein
MANSTSATAQHPVLAYYGTLTPKKIATVGSGLIAFVLDYYFRKEAYREGYSHLPPSTERLGLATESGYMLGAEAALVALVVASFVHCLISRYERPHQD